MRKRIEVSSGSTPKSRSCDNYEIRDEGSVNGTLINGQRTKRQRLANGDNIRIGDSEFVCSTREKKA